MGSKTATSILRRLGIIKALVKVYFDLPVGMLIDKHAELLRVFDVRGSKHEKHPHKMVRVYITRKALKHIVESRKGELLKRHGHNEALSIILFAIEHLQETVTDFDKYEYEPPTHYYLKDFAHEGKPVMRIAMDLIRDRLEIKSIHFTKRT